MSIRASSRVSCAVAAVLLLAASGCSSDRKPRRAASKPPVTAASPAPAPTPAPTPEAAFLVTEPPAPTPIFATTAEAIAAAVKEESKVGPALQTLTTSLSGVIAPHADNAATIASVKAYAEALECGIHLHGERFLAWKNWIAAVLLADDAALDRYVAAWDLLTGQSMRLRTEAELGQTCKLEGGS